MAKNIDLNTNAHHNNISTGTEITGDISTAGDIRLDGILNGNLNTKGKLIIGESGKITGEVTCKNADIEGKIDGKIMVSELLSLKATSVISGDIATSKLSIEPGAKFSGSCQMSGESLYQNAAKQAEKRPEKE